MQTERQWTRSTRLRFDFCILHYARRGTGADQPGFFATAAMIRLMISSSVGYGDFSPGRSVIGISSIRYAVPPALTPVTAVVKCTRASLLVCVTLGSRTIVGV